jgi:predicted transcriptional regulator
MMNKITMQEVAKEAGVSKAAVSYVMNQKPAAFGISRNYRGKLITYGVSMILYPKVKIYLMI